MEDLFGEVLNAIKDKMTITFTAKNVAYGDRFLIFTPYCRKQKVTFHTNCVPYWVEFEGDEPMRLEECPESFFRSILKNIPNK